jgi:hypothetical protein
VKSHAKASSAGSTSAAAGPAALRRGLPLTCGGGSASSTWLRAALCIAAFALLLVPAASAAAAPLLKVEVEGPGSGEISSVGGLEGGGIGEGTPAIECATPAPGTGTCENEMEEFNPEGEPGVFAVVLHAIPAEGSELVGWTIEGATETFLCQGSELQCAVFSTAAAVKVIAKFALETHTLTVAPTGEGEVDAIEPPAPSSGQIAGCTETGGECSASYTDGAAIKLVATPESGWELEAGSWTNCTELSAAECEVTLGADTTVEVNFVKEAISEHTLTINKEGSGDGSFECKTTGSFGPCQASYADGETITVKATADSHSTFAGWAGCSSTSGKECTITAIGADTTVTATFNLAQRTLTIKKAGTGNGSFECKTTGSFGPCQASYADGETITVKALEDSHSIFVSWAGCSSTAGSECTVSSISAAKTITATLNLIQRTLTIDKAGAGSGSFECKTSGSFGACQASYADGETITIKATPDSHSTFVSWAGCSATSGNECTITAINANTTVTAALNLAQPTIAADTTVTPTSTENVQCKVPKLKGLALGAARSAITRAHCKVGQIHKPKAKKGKKLGPLVVRSSSPAAGAVRPAGTKVGLTLGPKPKKSPRR